MHWLKELKSKNIDKRLNILVHGISIFEHITLDQKYYSIDGIER